MNCRDVARILPELVAGELDESKTTVARQHINICQSCASEFAGYKAALGALDQPWETVETPESLSFLHLPENTTNRAVFRPALIAAACAAAALLMFMIRLDHTPKPTISKAPAQVDRVPPNQPITGSKRSDVQQVKKPVNQTADVIQPAGNKQYKKPKVRHPKPRNKPISKPKQVPPKPKQQKQPESIEEETPEEPEVPSPKPIIVIASRIVEPSIELESYNCVTGVYSQYYVTYENSGKMTSEMESITSLE